MSVEENSDQEQARDGESMSELESTNEHQPNQNRLLQYDTDEDDPEQGPLTPSAPVESPTEQTESPKATKTDSDNGKEIPRSTKHIQCTPASPLGAKIFSSSRVSSAKSLTNIPDIVSNAVYDNSDPYNIFIEPTPAAINEKAENGDYSVLNLCVRHRQHGSVTFLGYRDLRLLGSNTDLSQIVKFYKGAVTIEGHIKKGAMSLELNNITRKDIFRMWGRQDEPVDDDAEFQNILSALGKLVNAIDWGYSEAEKTWVLVVLGQGKQ